MRDRRGRPRVLDALQQQEPHQVEGGDPLLDIVQRYRNFRDDSGRKTLLDVFNLLGGQGPLVTEYRRKLSSLLSS